MRDEYAFDDGTDELEAEILKELEEEFGDLSGEEVDETEDADDDANNGDNPDNEEASDETETTNDEESEEDLEAEQPAGKPTKEDKQKYAFAEVNKELSDTKKKMKEREEYFERLAIDSGFDSVESFTKAFEKTRLQKEAKDKGYDYELYSKSKAMEARIATLEKEKENELANTRAEKFNNIFQELSTEYELSDGDQQSVLKSMVDDGYDSDKIIKMAANPKKFIKGYMADMIIESNLQKRLKAKKEKSRSTIPSVNGEPNEQFDLDAFVDAEIKALTDEGW